MKMKSPHRMNAAFYAQLNPKTKGSEARVALPVTLNEMILYVDGLLSPGESEGCNRATD